jgi:asparagine synthase (glutamine-hydrolysing)
MPRMTDAIIHRGPDDAGVWADAELGIVLGHRRLSIVDLSPAGHQPMHSASGRFVLAYNGEIYNHLDLRAELEATGAAPCWRGHSDTETLLAAVEQWGLEATLRRTVGMFAIALWDRHERTLHLVRDRFGEKPLYYGWINGVFLFGSELKVLRAYPDFANPVCREALALYMRFTYVPAPRSIYRGIFKLEPGCLLSVYGQPPKMMDLQPLRPAASMRGITLRRWWSMASVVEAGVNHQIVHEEEAVTALEARLSDAVRLQSLADVPLGAFLSGGLDSSLIVALLQKQGSQPVKTFTVGFEEAAFDESPHARRLAQQLRTDHAEIFVTANEAQAVIRDLPIIYDEPFADSSQIPTHLVCRAARNHVTVALSGDAGDELFGGYNRYFWGARIWRWLACVPHPLRQALSSAIANAPISAWDAAGVPLNAILPGNRVVVRVGDRAHKLALCLRGVRSVDDLYRNLVSTWQDPAAVVLNDVNGALVEPPSGLDDPLPVAGVGIGQQRMMYLDSMTYLPDDILCKVDRAAMSNSLETRVPFLDHRVAELAWQLPLSMKIRGNQGKWALRQVLYKYVPRELVDRPKAGFAIPVGEWIRGPLRPWAESLLDEKRLATDGYFHPAPIVQRWTEHMSGRRDHTQSLWVVLMFQAWLDVNS